MTAATVPPSLARLAEAMDRAGLKYRLHGRQLDGQCPAHADSDPSMSATWQSPEPPDKAGRTVVECHAGCDRAAIPAALGLTWRDLMDGKSDRGQSPDGRRPSSVSRSPRPVPAARNGATAAGHEHRGLVEVQHVYADPDGTIMGRLDRVRCADPGCPEIGTKGKPGHAFVTRTPDGRAVKGAARAFADYLYRLPEVLAAKRDGRPVWLCEGEGKADAVAALGQCGTSSYGGAKRKIRPAYLDDLAGCDVIVVTDPGAPGLKRAAEWAELLDGRARSVRVMAPAIDRPWPADLTDHLEGGRGLDDLRPCDPAAELAELAAVPRAARSAPRPQTGTVTLDLDDVPPPPRQADAGAWQAAETAGGMWGSDGWSTHEVLRPKDKEARWRCILDAAVWFGAERIQAPDPDFADRAERDDPSEATEGAADVTVRYRRGGQELEHTVRAMPSSRARDMRALDKAGPSAWLGARPTPANRAKLFEASLALSEARGRPRDLVYGITGHHLIGGQHVLISGTNALGAAGVRHDLAVATDDRLAPWTWADPLPASELTEALAVVFALLDAADPRVVVPQVAAVIRAWFGVYRDPANAAAADEVSPLCWSTGVTGHGKSGVLAACCNLAAPGMRYNVLPFKAGPADSGGVSGASLERLLFRCRDLLLPFDDLDPAIPPGERIRWQSDLLRRAADQKSRGLAQRTGVSLRDSMPPRALVAAGGEPLDGEDSALNRALNLPFEVGTVDLAELRAQTTPDLRMTRARAGATVAARLMADWDRGHLMLTDAREAHRAALMPAGDARGPVLRAVGTVAELAAAMDAFLVLAVWAGADAARCRGWQAQCIAGLRDALARHLEIIGATTRSARFLETLREAIIGGAASLDDAAAPGCPPPDALAGGWEGSRGASLAADAEMSGTPDRYRRRGPQVGWLAADGSVWLAPSAAVAAARKLAEAAGERWTGSTRTVGETLKADGALVDHSRGAGDTAERAAADLPRPLVRAGLGKRAWHVAGEAWGNADGGDVADMSPPPSTPADDTAIDGTLENRGFTGGTGGIAGQSTSDTGGGTGGTPGAAGGTTGGTLADVAPAADISAGAGTAPGGDADRGQPERFPGGAVLLIDAGAAYLGDGADLPALPDLADMLDLAAGLGLGAPRLHKSGRDADPHLYLTPAACERYGIPAGPPDARTLALAEDHPAAVALRAAGWTVGAIRPSTQVYRRGEDAASLSVSLLGWLPHAAPGLESLTADDPSPASLARRLGTIAATAYPLRWTAGVTSNALMVALRPPYRLRHDAETGDRRRERVPGSLAEPVPPSLYDVHGNHPAARGRADADECREESLIWVRPREHWTPEELAAPWAVAIDVNAQFLAAAASLPVGLSAPRPLDAAGVAAVNAALAGSKPKIRPGVYVAEVSGLDPDPRLPCPLTETGEWPGGPLPLHAPTLRYARELGAAVTVSAAAVSDETGPYLDPWNRRLVAALLAALASAGITPDVPPADYLAALARMPADYPDAAAVVAVIKMLAKAGIGRMRQDPDGTGAADRATWRPDVRAEVISRARTDEHRKIMRTFTLTGIAPLAVGHDSVLYASDDPSALSVVPVTIDGGPVPGAFRIGCRPGWVKHSHTLPMTEALAQLDAGLNPAARHAAENGD
jgi:hypothetical protein